MNLMIQSFISFMKFLVEGLKSLKTILQASLRKYQGGNSEVVGSRVLSKTASGNKCDTSCFKSLQAIKEVSRLVESLGSGDGLV